MKRIRHAAVGMLAGWAVLQMVVFLFALVGAGSEWVRKGMQPNEVGFDVLFLVIFSACSAVVCLAAWLLIYLPVYWYWPRSSESWGKALFTYVGALCGGLIGIACIAARGPYLSLPVAFALIAMPTVTGGVSAFVGWWREEEERRYLEWQRQVTNPIFE